MSAKRLVECVPNFSEGRDMSVIKEITDAIESVDGVKLLDVDPGVATNRTVVTFVGEPADVVEAAFLGISKAADLIDMSSHSGEHPRMGATDVCPFIPISNITMEETADVARQLAARVGPELGIPVYLYENAASRPERQNLATVRAGEYEGLAKKLSDPEWKPDFGPAVHNVSAGATAIGARDFLIAYNVNLNTTSVRRANSVAFDVREQGRVQREGNPITGSIVRDATGEPVRIPGELKAVKGIGWFIEEYGIAQISMNLTDVSVTPLHMAFEACRRSATRRGLRVTGSELIGLVPLQVMLDVGKYYLRQQERSVGISEEEIIRIAVKSLGLDELTPFDPNKKIIEYVLKDKDFRSLVDLSLTGFADMTASENPAPGGGSVSAYVGALGASLGIMVANLSSHKRGWDDRWEEFSQWAEEGQKLKSRLLSLVDADTSAFNEILEAFRLPKKSESEKTTRKAAIQAATKVAIEVPLDVMRTASACFPLLKEMVSKGIPNSISDGGVGALAVRAAIRGAGLNVLINLSGIDDTEYSAACVKEVNELEQAAKQAEREILDIVRKSI
jgi:glutamate formiminotransferase / formiminotetrahydrofolate cyclodeaminase